MDNIEQLPAAKAEDALQAYEDSISYYFPEPVLVKQEQDAATPFVHYYDAA